MSSSVNLEAKNVSPVLLKDGDNEIEMPVIEGTEG